MLERFEFANPLKALNRWVQVALCVGFLLGLGAVLQKWPSHWQWQWGQRPLLTAETRGYVLGLKKPLELVWVAPDGTNAYPALSAHLQALLAEYERLGKISGQLTVRKIDPYKAVLAQSKWLQTITSEATYAIVLQSQGKHRLLLPEELVTSTGDFLAEQAITSALLELTQDTPYTIYFSQGNGEPLLDSTDASTGLSELGRWLRLRNYTLKGIDLATELPIPEDARLVILLGMQSPAGKTEVQKLRNYLEQRAGRVLILLGDTSPTGLEDFLADWGIQTPALRLASNSPEARTRTGQQLLRNFGNHPSVDYLSANGLRVIMQELRPLVLSDSSELLPAGLQVISLIKTPPQTFAQASDGIGTELNQTEWTIAALSQRAGQKRLTIAMPTSKVAVVGSSSWVGNGLWRSGGNTLFMANLIQTLVDKVPLASIPAHEAQSYQWSLTPSHWKALAVGLCVPLGVILAIGLGLWGLKKH